MSNPFKIVLALALIVFTGSIATASDHTPPSNDGEPIAVLTYVHLKPGTEDQFNAAVAKIIAPSRAEPGNIAWYVQQQKEDPTQIVFYTRWRSQAALDWHLHSTPIVEYIQRTASLLAEPTRLVTFHPLDQNPVAFPSPDLDSNCVDCSCCP